MHNRPPHNAIIASVTATIHMWQHTLDFSRTVVPKQDVIDHALSPTVQSISAAVFVLIVLPYIARGILAIYDLAGSAIDRLNSQVRTGLARMLRKALEAMDGNTPQP